MTRLCFNLKLTSQLIVPSCLVALSLGACDPGQPTDPNAIAKQSFLESFSCDAPKDRIATVVGAGSLDVSDDAQIAVASDAERAKIFVVDLTSKQSKSIDVEKEARVGRVLVHGAVAYVVAEGTGELLLIDIGSAAITARLHICSSPRGLGLSNGGAQLHVACASGELVSVLTADFSVSRRVVLQPDLRDVVALGDELVVSCFRSAELLVLNQEGEIVGRARPADAENAQANTAWRMIERDGAIYVLYQQSTTQALGSAAGSAGNPQTTSSIAYGSSSSGASCPTQIITPTLTRFVRAPDFEVADGETSPAAPAGSTAPDGEPYALWGMATVSLLGAVGAVDFDIDKSRRASVIIPGNGWAALEQRARISFTVPTSGVTENQQACFGRVAETPAVAVAVSDSGLFVTQSREPALIGYAGEEQIKVSTESRKDMGHRLFHMRADNPIACVSCHPAGDHDGHVWNFAAFGLRRTQSLYGGVSNRVRFHWDGSLDSFNALMSEVLGERMGMGDIPEEAGDCLSTWLDHLPDGSTGKVLDQEAVDRGEALFASTEVGCGDCHSGPMKSDRKAHDVGTGGKFVTPGLTGISTRAPFMHDGCSKTLSGRFDACGGGDEHGSTSQLSGDERRDLEAYLGSL